jgi:hypothetical protein
MMICLQCCFNNAPSDSAGSADKARTSRFSFPGGSYYFDTEKLFRLSANCTVQRFALVKAHGFVSPARNHESLNAPSRLAHINDEP